MKRVILFMLCASVSVPSSTEAAEGFMEFYKEEAKVVTASLLPHAANQSPSTVYTVTQEDIKSSGAQNIWDALRNVPGLHVMQTRTGQGELGIRGLNRALNDRTLILLDGQSVFNPYLDYLTWASLPVNMDDIDRIEVVEGPVSAVYGANALSGVVNIITKRPEQVNGTQVTYTGGEYNTHIGSIITGQKRGPLGYRVGGGWYTTNQFEDADLLGSQTGRFNGNVGYEFSKHSSLSVAGGFADYQAQVTNGITAFIDQGQKSYMRADYRFRDTLLRTNWNHNRGAPEDITTPQGYRLDYDNVEVGLEQVISLPFRNQAVIGGSYKNEEAHSGLLQDGKVSQDFWSTFFEDKWDISNKWLLMLSGRVDSHPLTPLRFSPRGSLLFTPAPEDVLRVSAGTSYRNPTLLESYSNFTQTFPNDPSTGIPDPPFSALLVQTSGNRDLMPESLQSVEAAYTHRTRRFTSSLTGYHWVAKDPIGLQNPTVLGPVSPTDFGFQGTFDNFPIKTYAWGSELALEYAANEWLKLFTNYTFNHVYGEIPPVTSPRHQNNTGFKTRNQGFTTQWVLHWMDSAKVVETPVPAYFMLDARVGYAFHGKLSGLEAAINAFNLLNHDHFEYTSAQGGEIVKGRLTGTLTYRF